MVSFGDDRRLVTPRTEDLALARAIAATVDKPGFWAVPRNSYAIERWSVQGKRERVLERRAPWFEPYEDHTDLTIGPDDPPRPQVMSLFQDQNGLRWTFVIVPDPDWRQGLVERRDPQHGTYYAYESYDRVFDTRIEVMDPSTGDLVASHRFNDALRAHGDIAVKAVETPVTPHPARPDGLRLPHGDPERERSAIPRTLRTRRERERPGLPR